MQLHTKRCWHAWDSVPGSHVCLPKSLLSLLVDVRIYMGEYTHTCTRMGEHGSLKTHLWLPRVASTQPVNRMRSSGIFQTATVLCVKFYLLEMLLSSKNLSSFLAGWMTNRAGYLCPPSTLRDKGIYAALFFKKIYFIQV